LLAAAGCGNPSTSIVPSFVVRSKNLELGEKQKSLICDGGDERSQKQRNERTDGKDRERQKKKNEQSKAKIKVIRRW